MLLFLMSADLDREECAATSEPLLCADWEVLVDVCDDLKIHCCCLFTLVITANKATGSVKHD